MHAFALPKQLDKYLKNSDNDTNTYSTSSARVIDVESTENEDNGTQNKDKKSERSNKWYFEIGYQQSFSISIFALVFVFSCIMPLALPLGAIFFLLKYKIDKYNMLYRYRIEYEADAYIRILVSTFSVFSIALFQLVMVFAFVLTGDDDMIVLALLLLIVSVIIV